MNLASRTLLVCAVLACLPCVRAQQVQSAERADGATVPLTVYELQAKTNACPPLALISPGAGGSERGLSYLGEGLSRDGWRAIVIGHKESGLQALRADMRREGFHGGLEYLISDPKAYQGRFMDIDAAVKWSEQRCHAPFKALLGHSMGARTVLLEAGAKNRIGIVGRNPFDAYVALSEPGADAVFPADGPRSVTAPMLMMTGTRDRTIDGQGYEERVKTFEALGSRCAWMGVVEGADHMNMAGSGFGARDAATRAVIAFATAFLDGRRRGECGNPPTLPGVSTRSK